MVDIDYLSTRENAQHPKHSPLADEHTPVSVSDATVSERSVSPKILKEVNHERKHCSFSGHHDYACPAY